MNGNAHAGILHLINGFAKLPAFALPWGIPALEISITDGLAKWRIKYPPY
jgi:hypothetical protein